MFTAFFLPPAVNAATNPVNPINSINSINPARNQKQPNSSLRNRQRNLTAPALPNHGDASGSNHGDDYGSNPDYAANYAADFTLNSSGVILPEALERFAKPPYIPPNLFECAFLLYVRRQHPQQFLPISDPSSNDLTPEDWQLLKPNFKKYFNEIVRKTEYADVRDAFIRFEKDKIPLEDMHAHLIKIVTELADNPSDDVNPLLNELFAQKKEFAEALTYNFDQTNSAAKGLFFAKNPHSKWIHSLIPLVIEIIETMHGKNV